LHPRGVHARGEDPSGGGPAELQARMAQAQGSTASMEEIFLFFARREGR